MSAFSTHSIRLGALRSHPHTVYAAKAADGTFLYVGCTARLDRRLRSHRRKPWWPQVDRVVTVKTADWYAGRRLEAHLIRTLDPMHNQVRMTSAKAGRQVNPEERRRQVAADLAKLDAAAGRPA